jgi:hypothetical protein
VIPETRLTRRDLLLAPFWQTADLPDIRSVPADLVRPELSEGATSAGRRVRQSLPAYEGTAVYHVLYLPKDWRPGVLLPVIAEYAGNGNYRNEFGDVSEGIPEGSNLGYGISGGIGYIWLCLPYVNSEEKRNQIQWWGDPAATAAYARDAVQMVCAKYGGDRRRILLAGFSRGSIGCNYIGLRDEATAEIWRGFVCYSHYDGVRLWPYPGSDRESALVRLKRLKSRPQFICHEKSVDDTRAYLAGTGVRGDFSLHALPFRNHSDAWVLRNIPLRRTLRDWVARLMA